MLRSGKNRLHSGLERNESSSNQWRKLVLFAKDQIQQGMRQILTELKKRKAFTDIKKNYKKFSSLCLK